MRYSASSALNATNSLKENAFSNIHLHQIDSHLHKNPKCSADSDRGAIRERRENAHLSTLSKVRIRWGIVTVLVFLNHSKSVSFNRDAICSYWANANSSTLKQSLLLNTRAIQSTASNKRVALNPFDRPWGLFAASFYITESKTKSVVGSMNTL